MEIPGKLPPMWRRVREERKAFLLRLSDALRLLTDPAVAVETATSLLAGKLNVDRCGMCEVHVAGGPITESLAGVIVALPAWLRHRKDLDPSFSEALRCGETIVLDGAGPREAAEAGKGAAGTPAAIVHPLLRHGQIVAVFVVEACQPRRWMETEVALASEVGERTWEAVERGRAEAARRLAEDRIRRQNILLRGIRKVQESALCAADERELGKVCLEVAEEVTESAFGFIGEIRDDGLLHSIQISDPGWERCSLLDKTGHRIPPGAFKLHGLYGHVLVEGKPVLANDPANHAASIGVPQGHPQLTAFLGVPLFHGEKVTGLIALANKDGGYAPDDVEAVTALATAVAQAFTRKRAEESLRESQLRLSMALEGGKMGMWEWECQTNRSVWNPTLYRLLGLPVGDGKLPSDLFFRHVHPEDLDRLHLSLERAIAERRNWEDEFRIVRADGEVRWLVGAARIFFDPRGRAERFLGVNYDITDRKNVENELRLTHDLLEQRVRERTVELEALNRELESFCYSVTHELGAPLRGMNCFSIILLDEYADRLDEEGRDYLERIGAATRRMGNLIEDLLKLSRVTRRKLSRGRVDLSAVARQIAADFTAQDPDRQVVFEIAGGVKGHFDPALAQLALQNLLGNAWKYTGKIAGARIEFGSFRQGSERVFFVRDNGIGFDMAYAEKIFLPFERLHRIGEYAGTGIGLATVQRVITMHGGRIWAESRVGEGAGFYFTEGLS